MKCHTMLVSITFKFVSFLSSTNLISKESLSIGTNAYVFCFYNDLGLAKTIIFCHLTVCLLKGVPESCQLRAPAFSHIF